MRLRSRNLVWLLFAFLVALLLSVWATVKVIRTSEALFTMLAGAWGLAYFLHQQHLESARFFRELFTSFNSRYDQLNDKLQAAIKSEALLGPEGQSAFIDYFNLCAEEHLFHKAGYLDKRVWEAWLNGMRQYARDPRVADLWRREGATDSYYGFEFPLEDTPARTPSDALRPRS